MTAVVSKYYKGISAERRKKEFFKAVGFEPRQVKLTKIKRTRRKRVFSALSRLSSLQYVSIAASSARKIIQKCAAWRLKQI